MNRACRHFLQRFDSSMRPMPCGKSFGRLFEISGMPVFGRITRLRALHMQQDCTVPRSSSRRASQHTLGKTILSESLTRHSNLAVTRLHATSLFPRLSRKAKQLYTWVRINMAHDAGFSTQLLGFRSCGQADI